MGVRRHSFAAEPKGHNFAVDRILFWPIFVLVFLNPLVKKTPRNARKRIEGGSRPKKVGRPEKKETFCLAFVFGGICFGYKLYIAFLDSPIQEHMRMSGPLYYKKSQEQNF
jgi:hypothetical protein